MEINITKLFNVCTPMKYSASRAEAGENAGPATWQAANDDSAKFMMLDNDEKREAFRDHTEEFGAWPANEIAAWTDIELNALFIQLIAGDIREAGLDTANPDWPQYEKDSDAGLIGGRMYKGSDGEIYYYVGN